VNKRTKEVIWISGVFVMEFALISLTYLFGIYHATNIYAGIFVFLLTFGVFYPIYLELTLFDTILSILTTTLYTFLWIFSIEVGLNIYFALINITIGVILALLIWVLHDRLVPLKGIWNKKIITEELKVKGMPFFFLILTGLWACVMTFTLLSNFSFLLFILAIVVFIGLIYYTLYYYDAAKKYVEKGEKHGKPKPKRRRRKASARPR